jgi:exodeoxyribonuclease V gamma subunit
MLVVHRASRGDWLVAGLADLLATPAAADPFTPEVVAVPTRGIERWLSQRLATVLGARTGRADGVCANIQFPFPAALIGGAVAAATGVDPGTDPWAPDRAVWPLLDVVTGSLGAPWLSTLTTHLRMGADTGGGHPGPTRDETGQARRFSMVRHLADLYDRYAIHRPAMIRAWAAGDDVDAAGGRLAPGMIWQAQLWRALRSVLTEPSPAERLEDACRQLRLEPSAEPAPRISLFGLTRLPASYLDVLSAMAVHRDVHLWLLHPSATLWSALTATVDAAGELPLRRHDPTGGSARNPLLATWGRDAREMQLVLAHGRSLSSEAEPEGRPPGTLLGTIQADVRADREPPTATPVDGRADPRPELVPGDRSLQVHACHGRARQVEVLRDAILHLLADDPTLQPRDVIVMCPDIDVFAPLIQATFGSGQVASEPSAAAGSGVVDLHVRLADRSIRQTNRVFGAVAHLLDLAADQRITASAVLDLADTEPVRRRFDFDDDDMARIDEWVRGAGVRWGLDAPARQPYKLAGVAAGTWRTGLDRLLLGVAMSEDDLRLVGDTLPYDDVDSGDVDLVGRLAELIDRLDAVLHSFAGRHPIGTWVRLIAEAADALMATSPADAWQHGQLVTVLEAVAAEAAVGHGTTAADPTAADPTAANPTAANPTAADPTAADPTAANPTSPALTGAGTGTPLTLAEIRAVLADRLRGRPTRANFRTGHLTMCTLVPMRSVPHRVVCLLGLDDGVFPRHVTPDGDDLLARDPRVGDREARSEDRQLLLDALLAAEDHLIITYLGHDDRTNAECPPAVPVGELLDVIDRTVRTADGTPARQAVVVHHPLQPFDLRNFQADALVPGRPWSFDRVALGGAQASVRARSPHAPFLAGPLPAERRDPVPLEDLISFVQHPVKAFLRQRLGVGIVGDWPEPGDGLPVELTFLERWQVGDRLLQDRLAGIDETTCRAAETVRGGVPPGRLGETVLAEILPTVASLVAAAGGGVPAYVDVTASLGERTVAGTVGGVIGHELRSVTYSKLAAKHRLAAWVRLVALSAARPDQPWEARSIGRGRRKGSVGVATVGPLGSDPDERRRLASAYLALLVELYDHGLRAPLPMACDASAAWAEAAAAGKDPVEAASREWDGNFDWPGENAEPAHRLALGATLPMTTVLLALPLTAETGPGWADDEPSRFGRLARRLWDDLLSCERRS